MKVNNLGEILLNVSVIVNGAEEYIRNKPIKYSRDKVSVEKVVYFFFQCLKPMKAYVFPKTVFNQIC